MTAQMDSFKSENNSTTDLIGQNWQKLIDLIENRPDDNEAKSFDGGGVHRSNRADDNILRMLQDVKRLRQKDMPLFGHCPETDTFYTVVCSICSMILMPHALKEHYDKRHGDEEKTVPSAEKTSTDAQNKAKTKKATPVKLEKPDKPKKVKTGSGSEAIEEILKDPKRMDKIKKLKPPQPEAEPSIGLMTRTEKTKQKNGNGSRFATEVQSIVTLSPVQSTAESGCELNNGKDLPKKKQKEKKKNERKTDKVFDPDKHCGVINETGKPCVRSILCKVHQVALKRAVPNRSMTYDMLIRVMKTHGDDEKGKPDGGLFRGKPEPGEKVVDGLVKPWTPDQVKTEEPPIKRLKVKEEDIAEDEADQSQFALPSHLEALIDETLRTLKEVEESEPAASLLPPKPEPVLKWDLDREQQKEPSPPPQIVVDDVLWHSNHPKPLATNTFGCRLIGGLMSTCKKLDTLRKHLQSVWTSSSATTTSINSCFGDAYSPNGKPNGCAPAAISKNSFAYSKYSKKSNVASKATPLAKKTVPSPAMKGTSVKRKRRTSAGIAPVPNTSNASEIISGLLISNTVPIQRTATIPTGVIPVNSITGNGVPLRLFQGSLPVIASTAPNQPATFIQLNLCPK